MSYAITPAVRRVAEHLFSAAELTEVLTVLESTDLPLLPDMTHLVERIHLAVLHSCGGTMLRFHATTAAATEDWRDVLVGAGLGGEDWRIVLLDRGITPSFPA